MAEEERGGSQNVWLLIIALALGLVVVVIYNVHIDKVRKEGRGKQIALIRVTRDIEAGAKLDIDDLETKYVPKQYEGSLGNVVPAEYEDFAIGSQVNRAVEKGQWLQWSHITGTDTTKASGKITRGNVAVAIPLEPRMAPGDILSVNDRVNICGLIPRGRELKTFRIIRGVRVLAIGGEGIKVDKAFSRTPSKAGSRSYRNITVEVSPEVSLQLTNVLTHISGSCWVELLSAVEQKDKDFGKIDSQLQKEAAAPSGPAGGAYSSGGSRGAPSGGAGAGDGFFEDSDFE